MKRRFYRIILMGLAIVFFNKLAYAVDSLTAFQVTIQKLEISRNGGKTYMTIFDNNSAAIDLVQINGQSVGTFIGNMLVPAGTYNKSRVTISDVTIQFTVNNEVNGNGTITITQNDMPAGTFPRTELGNMTVAVSANGTVNGVINFDAATSYSGLTYIFNGGAAPNQYTLTGVTFNPNVSVTSE